MCCCGCYLPVGCGIVCLPLVCLVGKKPSTIFVVPSAFVFVARLGHGWASKLPSHFVSWLFCPNTTLFRIDPHEQPHYGTSASCTPAGFACGCCAWACNHMSCSLRLGVCHAWLGSWYCTDDVCHFVVSETHFPARFSCLLAPVPAYHDGWCTASLQHGSLCLAFRLQLNMQRVACSA